MLNMIARSKFAALTAGILGLVVVTPATAGSEVTVTVNATVGEVCTFNPSTATLNLTNKGTGSEIDPSSATAATGSVDIIYRCSNGTVPAFTVPSSVTLETASDSMVASIEYTSGGAGTGMGNTEANQKKLKVEGSIASSIFQDKPPGLYTKDMTVSISY